MTSRPRAISQLCTVTTRLMSGAWGRTGVVADVMYVNFTFREGADLGTVISLELIHGLGFVGRCGGAPSSNVQ
jgi:hypothetical protein